MPEPLDVLIVDDESTYRSVLARELGRLGARVRISASAEEGLVQLSEAESDVVLLDLRMPGMGGIGFLHELRANDFECEVIVLTGHPDLDTAVEALRHGAYDYLSKPVDLEVLGRSVERAGERSRLRRENRALRRALSPAPAASTVRSQSPRMSRLFEQLGRVAAADCTVLLSGETGTGKEVVAHEIHRQSGRGAQALVVVDCASLQGSVRNRELFGHDKGAFTGADRASPGLFEAAHRGTVFLDEIGELDLEGQAALLRVLETGEIRRVGATRSRKIDARVVAATNRDLDEEVRAGRFREDLLYRLQVVQLDVPPLRQRSEDILPLFRHFMQERCGASSLLDKEVESFFLRYDWPGNVRELRNVAERVAVLGNGGEVRVDDLPPRMFSNSIAISPTTASPELSLKEIERRHILAVYAASAENKRQASERLGISLRTLYNKLAEYAAPPDSSDIAQSQLS